MTDTAMKELFAKFRQFWRSGTEARLNLECQAGQAWLHLRVHLPPQPHQHPQQQKRKPGPSRLRRRERRAQARAAAANATAENTTTENSSVEKAAAENVTAENASNESNSKVTENVTNRKTREIAVQADLSSVAHQTQAEKADDTLGSDREAEPEQPTIETTHTPIQLNVDAKPWILPECNVQDVFCPDQQYRVQLKQPHSPPNQCNMCGKTFGSNRALANHVKQDHAHNY